MMDHSQGQITEALQAARSSLGQLAETDRTRAAVQTLSDLGGLLDRTVQAKRGMIEAESGLALATGRLTTLIGQQEQETLFVPA